MDLVGIDHVGIRVAQFTRSIEFYSHLGFGVSHNDTHEQVVALMHPSGVELNLIVNAESETGGKNILMDMDFKYPGYTHFALQVASIADAIETLKHLKMPITEGPVTFSDGKTSVFIRDPDRNVIEFTQLPEPSRA